MIETIKKSIKVNINENRISMNDLLSTPVDKKHEFESKNDYKDYPCDCGAINNSHGKTCWRYKATKLKDNYGERLISSHTYLLTKMKEELEGEKMKPPHEAESFEKTEIEAPLSNADVRNAIKTLENRQGFDYRLGYNQALEKQISKIDTLLAELNKM
jgi:hypothetical protein